MKAQSKLVQINEYSDYNKKDGAQHSQPLVVKIFTHNNKGHAKPYYEWRAKEGRRNRVNWS